MGWKSTMDITKEDALAEIYRLTESANDEEVANALEALIGDRLGYNFYLVKEYSGGCREYGGSFPVREPE